MRVLVVFPPKFSVSPSSTNGLVQGGLSVARALVSRGHSVSTYTPNSVYPDMPNVVPPSTRAAKHAAPLTDLLSDYDIIHVHTDFYYCIILSQTLPPSDRVVVTNHSGVSGGRGSFMYKLDWVSSFSKFTCTYHSRDTFISALKILKISDTVGPCRFISNIVDDVGVGDPEPIISIISRMDAMKNPIKSIELAARDCRRLGYEVKYVGDPDVLRKTGKAKSYRDQVLSCLDDNVDVVEFIPRLDRSDMRSLLRRSMAVYHFSLLENQPLIPLEAMSAGVPTAGLARVICGHNRVPEDMGVFTDTCSPSLSLLRSLKLIDRSRLRPYYLENFSEEAVVSSWLSLYEGVV